MALKLKLTHLSQLDTIVIKQSGGHFFVSTPNSIIIDRAGYLQLMEALVEMGFISTGDLGYIAHKDRNKEAITTTGW